MIQYPSSAGFFETCNYWMPAFAGMTAAVAAAKLRVSNHGHK